MIKENIDEIINHLIHCDIDTIGSLRIDRRKPHTDRLFFQLPSNPKIRVCLHVFQPCEEDEAFAHPHSWESEIAILKGAYKHSIQTGTPLDTDGSTGTFYESSILYPFSSYSISKPTTWHKVQPLKESWTLMINKEPWKKHSIYCKFTKSKELVVLPAEVKRERIKEFISLLFDYKQNII